MKKIINREIFFTILTSVTVSGFIVICTLGQSVYNKRVQSKLASAVAEPQEPVCTVREYNGKIGVFRGSGNIPYKVIDYDVSLLSDYDREQLRSGIVIDSDAELRQFIEDMAT